MMLNRFSLVSLASLALAACSSGSSGSGGGPVEGPADSHCGAMAQATSPDACHPMGTGGGGTGGGGTGGGGAEEEEYGATMYNAEGDDDDCKYHVKWSASGVAENEAVSFTIELTHKTDSTPATGSTETYAEVFLSDTHPAPSMGDNAAESPAGTYTIPGVKFDASGQWTVRFHFFGDCEDGEESPHSHAAFFVQVP